MTRERHIYFPSVQLRQARRGQTHGLAASAGPLEWKLVGEKRWLLVPDQSQDEASGRDPHWFLLPGGEMEALAIVDKEADDGLWLYDLKFLDEVTEKWVKMDQILVREVSASILLNCNIVIKDKQSFQATITTLSGNEFLSVEQTLPPVLHMGYLMHLADREAESKGLLNHGDDHNTILNLFLNGSAATLGPNTVLWDKLWESGWLKTHRAAP